ncbi:MAG: ABC transporter ATP-binding protein [Mucinivorans sp.]
MELKNIVLGYKGSLPLSSIASCGVGSGLSVALIGRNGVGKSTLLRSMAGIVAPRGGEILLDGVSIQRLTPAERAEKVSFVSTEIIQTAYMSVAQIVALGRAPYCGWAGRLTASDRAIVERAMDSVDVAQFATRTIDTLSDGQRQRVMVARALAQDTPVMVLDEPTAFLDWENREMVIRLLCELASSTGKIIIFSTHERDLALSSASHVWQLSPEGIEVMK